MRCRGPAEEFLFSAALRLSAWARGGCVGAQEGGEGGVGAARRGIGRHVIGLLYSVPRDAQQRSSKSLVELQ